jgi:hypothetical protein
MEKPTIKAYKLTPYHDVFVCDKNSIKEWIESKGWTEIHEIGKATRGHVKRDKVFENIDQCEAVIVYTKNVHENHRLALIMGNMDILYYNVLEILSSDIEEYYTDNPVTVETLLKQK